VCCNEEGVKENHYLPFDFIALRRFTSCTLMNFRMTHLRGNEKKEFLSINSRAFPSGRAFTTRFPAEKAGRAQTMAQSLTQIGTILYHQIVALIYFYIGFFLIQ
jgi:hypothetical protein